MNVEYTIHMNRMTIDIKLMFLLIGQIRDLDLGAQFPEIKNIKVLNADLHDTEGHLDNLELVLDLHYSGNFRMAIDADMVLGKKGSLSVKG